MPSITGMNIGRRSMGGAKKKKSGSEFWKRWQGAKDKGFSGREAAAIAGKEASEQLQRQKLSEAAQKLRVRMFPHLRR